MNANGISTNEIRKRLARAGVIIEYRRNKIVTSKGVLIPVSWQQSWNDNRRERGTLLRIAEAYNVRIATA